MIRFLQRHEGRANRIVVVSVFGKTKGGKLISTVPSD